MNAQQQTSPQHVAVPEPVRVGGLAAVPPTVLSLLLHNNMPSSTQSPAPVLSAAGVAEQVLMQPVMRAESEMSVLGESAPAVPTAPTPPLQDGSALSAGGSPAGQGAMPQAVMDVATPFRTQTTIDKMLTDAELAYGVACTLVSGGVVEGFSRVCTCGKSNADCTCSVLFADWIREREGVHNALTALKEDLAGLVSVYSFLRHKCAEDTTAGYFTVLPLHVIHRVMAYLDAISLARCCRVCRIFAKLATSEKLWQRCMQRECQPHTYQHLVSLNFPSWRLGCRALRFPFPEGVVRNGYGTYCYQDGSVFQGQFVDNMRHGKGIHSAAFGTMTYIGEWRHDKKDGWGITVWAQGKRHEGWYENNARNGRGVFTWANGHKYEGYFKDDKRHGEGIFTFTDGSKWDGNFKENERHYGTYIWPNNSRRYQGYWKKSSRHGEGRYWWPDGCMYEGSWVDDKREGHGTLIWSDGCRFEGTWKDSKRWGEGIFYSGDGTRVPQRWREAVFNRHDRGVTTLPPPPKQQQPAAAASTAEPATLARAATEAEAAAPAPANATQAEDDNEDSNGDDAAPPDDDGTGSRKRRKLNDQ
eukprot:TRINITY_DN3111_c0_g2_i2.p1 TRINITY_DN3111_c0_g2~~TRINITY_DN3111_c0_g2_i2.p1  ORF type:complete len:585 (-),score=108.75 TRINITY_DN3111_c0_g2_i2:18-1772(-)